MDEHMNAEDASADAIHQAKTAAEAIETARQAQNVELLKEMAIVAEEAVIKALNRGEQDKRYIDIGRIPFLCDDNY